MERKRRLLFVCVGNTCRSQMAEGFARKYGEGRVEVKSAGTAAAGMININTINEMKRRGIDITGQTSDQLTDDMVRWADVVVTLGCCSAKHLCPVNFNGEQYAWPIEDPLGSPPEVMERVADDIERRVKELIGQ